ncbi:MAG TPA: cation:proton antiporter [Candidatus Elarobacter sp.]
MSDHGVALGVAAFAALLTVAVLVSIAAERVRVPAAVAMVAVGTAAGSLLQLRPPFEFGPAVLFVFLPPLVFEAAWNVDLRALRERAGRIALLAFPGTLLSAFAIAGALAATRALPFGAALLFGAMVSATDPIAVVAVFRRAAVPVGLRTLVECESLANDGVAVVLYGIGLSLAAGAHLDALAAIAFGVVQVAGAIGIGAALAYAGARVLRLTSAAEYEVTATVALAYAAYLAADALHLSGIFATAAAGITLRALLDRDEATVSNVRDVDRFWNAGAYIANALVFIATGLAIDAGRALHEPLLIGVALAVTLAARVPLAFAAGPGRAARVTVFLAGMRGALPLALALSLPEGLAHRAEIIDAVFATVLVTLVVQGATLEPVVRRLYRRSEPAGA